MKIEDYGLLGDLQTAALAHASTDETDDGLPGSEGQFLACSSWLVMALARNGRVDEARALFERLLGLTNAARTISTAAA